MTAARRNDAQPEGGQGLRGTEAELSRETREEIAQTLLRWALPTLAVLLAVFYVLLATWTTNQPTRFFPLTIWSGALLLSGWLHYARKQSLHGAAALLIGLALTTTTGTLIHGVDAPAFIGVMPVMALLVPLFGVRWGLALLGWHLLLGLLALWLGAHGHLLNPLPLSIGVRYASRATLACITLAFLYVPTRLLVRALRVAQARLQEVEQAREQERKSALALREASEQLAQARRLESLGKLSAGVAHDFNNMLGAIIAATDLISLDRTGNEHPELEQNLELIRGATERAADLTRKLLAFGRQDNLEPQPIDVNAMVRETAALARTALGSRVKLELDCASDSLWVRGDRSALDHALFNLLLNARDALAGEGIIRIRTRAVTLEPAWCEASSFAVAPGPAVQLSVEDTGSGIPTEVRERLFEPFFTTKPAGRGTGLGLSAVHGTVAAQKGALEVSSEPGRGTVFHVYLPLDAERLQAPTVSSLPPRQSASIAVGHGTLLIVDDDELHGRAVAALARQLGYDAQLLMSARVALDLLSQGVEVTAIVSDIVMPDMDGAAFARVLAERAPRLALVLMSGFAPDGALARLPPHTVLLRKPFGRDELQASLAQALGAATRPAVHAIAL